MQIRQISKKLRFSYTTNNGTPAASGVEFTVGGIQLPPALNFSLRNISFGYSGSASAVNDNTNVSFGRSVFLIHLALGDVNSMYTWLSDTLSAYFGANFNIYNEGTTATNIASAADLQAYSPNVQDKDWTAGTNYIRYLDASPWPGANLISRLYARMSVIGAYSQMSLIPSLEIERSSNYSHLWFVMLPDISRTGFPVAAYPEDTQYATAGMATGSSQQISMSVVNAELIA